jgi:hypothetical protein
MQCPYIEEEILDRYAMGTLSDDLLPSVEEHLLTCERCQSRLMETDQFMRVFRTAATEVEVRPAGFWKSVLLARRARWAAAGVALASLLVVLTLIFPRKSTLPAAIVQMQSFRGAEASASVAAGKPSVLAFDLGSQSTSKSFRVEILNVVGAEVLSADADMTGGRASVAVKGLTRGSYWVRVYRKENNELTAEYILRAE